MLKGERSELIQPTGTAATPTGLPLILASKTLPLMIGNLWPLSSTRPTSGMNTTATRHLRLIALVLTVLHIAACTTWQPTPVNPRALVEQEAPGAVRVQGADGEWQTISGPVVEGDSITGLAEVTLGTSSRTTLRPTRVALAEIGALQTKQFSLLATTAAFIVVPVIVITVVAAFVRAGEDCETFCR